MSTSNNTTSVPASSLTDAGFVSPSEQQILAGVTADLNAALGGNGNPALTTPQGQMASCETKIIGDCNDALLSIINGVDPRNATGRMQDAIGYIYFMTRQSGETAAAFETRRAATVEGNSVGVNSAIMTALLNIPGITDAYVVDNPQTTMQTLGGINVSPNTVYCSVYSPTLDFTNAALQRQIAGAILSKKPPGSGTGGATYVNVQDTSAIYNGNGPVYGIRYDSCFASDTYFDVTIKNSTLVPSNALTLIQNAIIASFTGANGDPRITIGSYIRAGRFYGTVAQLGAWAEVVSIKTHGLNGPPSDAFQWNINQMPTINPNTITLTLV